jgi:hypothetical protein
MHFQTSCHSVALILTEPPGLHPQHQDCCTASGSTTIRAAVPRCRRGSKERALSFAQCCKLMHVRSICMSSSVPYGFQRPASCALVVSQSAARGKKQSSSNLEACIVYLRAPFCPLIPHAETDHYTVSCLAPSSTSSQHYIFFFCHVVSPAALVCRKLNGSVRFPLPFFFSMKLCLRRGQFKGACHGPSCNAYACMFGYTGLGLSVSESALFTSTGQNNA